MVAALDIYFCVMSTTEELMSFSVMGSFFFSGLRLINPENT
jgi:hypothetical protein